MTDDATRRLGRRTVLGGLLGATAGTAGCVQRLQNIVGREGDDPPSLTIKTMPADADEQAVSIAGELADHLTTVGIDTNVAVMARSQLYRDVLLNHDFDVYVARYPGHADPDFLRPLLHSQFTEDLGWQNPFGFVDLGVDDLLDEQRRVRGHERRSVVADLQRDVSRRQPFTVVAFPDFVRAVRPDRYTGWDSFDPDSSLGYLRLASRNPVRSPETAGTGDGAQLRLTTTDARATENFNPLMVEFRTGGAFTDLVYDRLARRYDGAVRPWLARDWTWETDRSAARQRATVDLREGATWHDGPEITAADVAFTYRFLDDTWLGTREVPAPSPRFHGRVSLVDGVTVLDDHTVRISFEPCQRAVARRALRVPILPEREWRPKATAPSFAGLDLSEGVTEALVWNNPKPIGSGPLRFEERASGEQLVLARFEDHFLEDEATVAGGGTGFEGDATTGDSTVAGSFGGGTPFDQLGLRVVPSSRVAVELIDADRADATATPVNVDVVPRIGRADALRLHATGSRSFYHVGFNARRAPLSNPRFRRSVARLVDRAHLVDDVFDGYATPAVSPLDGSEWMAPSLQWSGESQMLPFFGDDGTLDVDRARTAFRDAGFPLDHD